MIDHGLNMIILSMIKTTSRGSLNHDQTKHGQNGDERVHKRTKIGPIKAKCLVEIWACEEIQRQ